MEAGRKTVSPLTDIPDHLLTEILLRLPAPDDLARASATCIPFRRLVTDGSFLRRFRRLHAPPLLAVLDRDGFHPALPPHPSAPAARALALAADFTFSFLPSHCRWKVQDIRDGRVLLCRKLEKDEEPRPFRELAVCDPLHRRYVLLPPVPDDLAASVEHVVPMVCRPQCEPFLVPHLEEEEVAAVDETTFRVIWMTHCKTKVAAFLFSSSTRKWQAAASKSWSDLVLDRNLAMMHQIHSSSLGRHYAYGCFYWDWVVIGSQKLLMLDTRRMEFSIADLPHGGCSTKGVAIVEAGEGRLGIFGFDGEFESHLCYAIARKKDESPIQWQMEKTIRLDSGYKYYINAATERHLLLIRTSASSVAVEYFSMDAKTMQLQRVCAKQCSPMYGTHIYTNFPPSLLSSRAI